MKYNGKEIEVTCTFCTLENDTIKIFITAPNNWRLPFTNINKAAKFLVDEYGGTKEEALLALNNCITRVVVKHLPESIKNLIVRNAVYNSISDELRDFVVNCIVYSAIPDKQKELIVEAKLRQSKLLII